MHTHAVGAFNNRSMTLTDDLLTPGPIHADRCMSTKLGVDSSSRLSFLLERGQTYRHRHTSH